MLKLKPSNFLCPFSNFTDANKQINNIFIRDTKYFLKFVVQCYQRSQSVLGSRLRDGTPKNGLSISDRKQRCFFL